MRHPLLVHVGYHKTGTSWLQTQVFDDERRGFTTHTGFPRHRIAEDFAGPEVFSFSAKRTRDAYLPALGIAQERGLTLVLSHERLSGYPGSGGYDRKQLADRLAETFPEARVLLVLREQRALIRSMYSQYITDGGDQYLHEFLRTPERRLARIPRFSFEYYDFHHLIGYYQSLIGPTNVLVLPQELLVSKPAVFLSRIAHFCGTPDGSIASGRPVNERRPVLMQHLLRFTNRYFSRSELSPTAFFSLYRLPRSFSRLRRLFAIATPAWVERALNDKIVSRNRGGGRFALCRQQPDHQRFDRPRPGSVRLSVRPSRFAASDGSAEGCLGSPDWFQLGGAAASARRIVGRHRGSGFLRQDAGSSETMGTARLRNFPVFAPVMNSIPRGPGRTRPQRIPASRLAG